MNQFPRPKNNKTVVHQKNTGVPEDEQVPKSDLVDKMNEYNEQDEESNFERKELVMMFEASATTHAHTHIFKNVSADVVHSTTS
ncbi:hypothetical protein T07_13947 [Trichinella nelsoni]|uniref:Uncharacterized protein n=1 Tax=Trichinella nelsoni TaxID=6336 RepID=A0A0V0RW95_9BILA|nr:hypothetical protein T07_13947 [Trichinella nelsoni]